MLLLLPLLLLLLLQFRSEAREGSDKECQLITCYSLVGRSAAQVDGWLAKAYDAYRALLRGEQAASKADRCACG
jgi:hypothetical protein